MASSRTTTCGYCNHSEVQQGALHDGRSDAGARVRLLRARDQLHGAVLTIFWQTWICFALVYLIAGCAFVAGTLVPYACYLFVRHCAHRCPNKVPLPLLKHHQSHRAFATRNCSVSTMLWDHVCGTMRADLSTVCLALSGR
jgi:hypothetical protein